MLLPSNFVLGNVNHSEKEKNKKTFKAMLVVVEIMQFVTLDKNGCFEIYCKILYQQEKKNRTRMIIHVYKLNSKKKKDHTIDVT